MTLEYLIGRTIRSTGSAGMGRRNLKECLHALCFSTKEIEETLHKMTESGIISDDGQTLRALYSAIPTSR